MDFHKLREEYPEEYPEVTGLSLYAQTLNMEMIWGRIENYVVWRWSPRSSVWLANAEAGEQFTLPLAPVSNMVSEFWNKEGWETHELQEGPFGLIIPRTGPWRFTATLGAGVALPETVAEAFRRIAEYLAAEDVGIPGASRYSINIGQVTETFSRNPAHIARALINSGAADLLRRYRRV